MPSEARLAIRQDQSTPKIADFETWLTHHRARVSAKSPLGEALKYIAKYWAGLCLFLADGRIEIDNASSQLKVNSACPLLRTPTPLSRHANPTMTVQGIASS